MIPRPGRTYLLCLCIKELASKKRKGDASDKGSEETITHQSQESFASPDTDARLPRTIITTNAPSVTANQFGDASQYYLTYWKGSYHPLLDVCSFCESGSEYILLITFFAGGVVKEEVEG